MQLGFAETILLNASLSQDPNEPDGSLGLKFEWACIPDNRTLMSRLPFNSKPASILSFLPIKYIIYWENYVWQNGKDKLGLIIQSLIYWGQDFCIFYVLKRLKLWKRRLECILEVELWYKQFSYQYSHYLRSWLQHFWEFLKRCHIKYRDTYMHTWYVHVHTYMILTYSICAHTHIYIHSTVAASVHPLQDQSNRAWILW